MLMLALRLSFHEDPLPPRRPRQAVRQSIFADTRHASASNCGPRPPPLHAHPIGGGSRGASVVERRIRSAKIGAVCEVAVHGLGVATGCLGAGTLAGSCKTRHARLAGAEVDRNAGWRGWPPGGAAPARVSRADQESSPLLPSRWPSESETSRSSSASARPAPPTTPHECTRQRTAHAPGREA